MSILICLTILLAWTSQCASLSLTPSTKILSRCGTSNFTLNCTIDDHPNSTTSDGGLEEIHRMRIVKRGKDRWNTVVEMSPEWKDPKVADDFQSKLTAESGQTYIQVTWPMASNDTIGQYMCDLFGYSWSGESVLQQSEPVFINDEPRLGLFELFAMTQKSYQMNEKVLRDISKNKEIIHKMDSSHEAFQKQMENTTRTLESILADMAMMKQIIAGTVHEESTVKDIYNDNWPQGRYALIEPETGCPVDSGVEWKRGYRKHHTESTDKNHDHVSTPAHMKKPVMQKENGQSFVTQHHCSVIEPSPGRAWPAGSYCVMKYRRLACPVGFEEGYIMYDEETVNNNSTASGYNAFYFFTLHESDVHYCCRNDSLPNEPIHLPTRKPFYLHRYGGICQQVKAMNVTDEFIFFDEDNSSPTAKFVDFAPDDASSLPDVKLQLCYYEPI